jgi:hypothetical protein
MTDSRDGSVVIIVQDDAVSIEEEKSVLDKRRLV